MPKLNEGRIRFFGDDIYLIPMEDADIYEWALSKQHISNKLIKEAFSECRIDKDECESLRVIIE